MFRVVTHLKCSMDVTRVLIMRLIANRVCFAVSIASYQSIL